MGFMSLMAIGWCVPLALTVWTAFRPESPDGLFSFTLGNFAYAWSAAPFDQYYWNTIVIVLGILAVQLVTVTLAAYAFGRLRFWGRDALLMIVLVQIMVPADMLIAPNYGIIRELGLFDTKLAVMIPYFASAFGIFLLRQTFKSVPYELEEAARMEGCGVLRIIRTVYVPLSIPAYVAFSIVSISHHWNNFLWPLIVTNSEENRPLTVGLAMLAQAFETGAAWSEVTAATIIVTLPLLLGFLLFQRGFINSFMHSGIK
ncbi:carbohydrate ABC transporter permease [Paenibacillus sp. TRM 82003]|nr:carbohydrate ABC transporter permease [Paenibacillus sp. TRM 82003]MCI3923362.1 carbohydrate ABC transporter permease [Paenibacillus sp. TRM 82003]